MRPLRRVFRRLPPRTRAFAEWTTTIVAAVAIVLTIKVEIANPYRIPSASMEPTLQCARPTPGCSARFSDRVIANRFIYRLRSPRRGEQVVFHAPAAAAQRCGEAGIFVKRLIGLPGERVALRDGVVFVDGERLAEPYVDPARQGADSKIWPRLPPGHFIMLGDNRDSSCDSRQWGLVPKSSLIGPVMATYWPPNRVGLP